MATYCLLPHPGVNAVFFDASARLSLAELSLCLPRLDVPGGNAREEEAAGLRWYCFDAEAPLGARDVARLAALSSAYALFLREGELLRPVPLVWERPFGDDLSAILKYTGKTNALFTRLLLHIAELSLPDAPADRPLRLLDPVAGKGTTLFEALMRGWDACGIEIVQKAAHEGAVYFQKYLETGRWKHTLQKEKAHGAPAWRFAFARDKDALRRQPGRLTLIAGDARLADKYFGKGCFDVLAGDLPYGVAHGTLSGGSLTRTPAPLLSGALPAWHAVLRPGGVLALSWNTLVYPVEAMRAMLADHGFSPCAGAPYDALSHRVDASIRRDIVFAVRN